jgi:hypothetical protein
MKRTSHSIAGGATLYTLCFVIVLSGIAAVVVRQSLETHLNTFRAAGWEECLLSAESGIDLGISQLRKNAGVAGTDWIGAWEAAFPTTPAGQTPKATDWTKTTVTETVTAANGQQTTVTRPVMSLTSPLSHAGEGATSSTATVSIDCPATLIDSKGWRYFRLRSVGTVVLPGSKEAGRERTDLDLRKYSLNKDRWTGQLVALPRVTRTVEAVVRPK